MPVVESTRPSLDVDINIFHRLYTVGMNRWYTVLLATDDPGPSLGTITIYGDMAAVALDYPEHSATYRACDQFFDQHNVDEIHVLPVTPEVAGAEPQITDWSSAINTLIANSGLTWYYTACVVGKEVVVSELADAVNNYEALFFAKNYVGDRATLVTGAALTEVTWLAREEGANGNKHTVTYTDPDGNDQELAITMLENVALGYDIDVSLATDNAGAITTTPAEIVAAIIAHSDLSFLVFCEGVGTSAVSAEVKANLTGGGANAGTDESFGTVLSDLASSRVLGMTHDRPAIYHPDVVAAGICSVMNPGSFTLKNRIPQGIPEADYTPTERNAQRVLNINSIFTNPAGHLNITDAWASDGSYIDIQMAIDVLTHWMRMGIWDLLSQPPTGYNKVPYDNDGFAMIQDRLMQALQRGSRRQWNFICSRGGRPCARVHCPTFQQCSTDDRKNRIYRPWFEATYKGAIHEVDVTGYLTVEYIPPAEQRLGTGIDFEYE